MATVKSSSSCCLILSLRNMYNIAAAALAVRNEWRDDWGRWFDENSYIVESERNILPPRPFASYNDFIYVFSWAQKWKACEERRRIIPAIQGEIDQTFLGTYRAGFDPTQSTEDFMSISEPVLSKNIVHMRLQLGRYPVWKWRLKEAKFWREFFTHPPLPNLRSVSLEFNHEHGCRSYRVKDQHKTHAITDVDMEFVQGQRKVGIKQDLELLEALCMMAMRNGIVITMADSNNGCEWCSDSCQAIVASVEK